MERKKNFWNDWDLKSILAIVIPLLTVAFGYGSLTSKVTAIETTRLEDIKRFQEDVTEIKVMLKDYIKEQEQKDVRQQNDIKEFYKRYKLEEK